MSMSDGNKMATFSLSQRAIFKVLEITNKSRESIVSEIKNNSKAAGMTRLNVDHPIEVLKYANEGELQNLAITLGIDSAEPSEIVSKIEEYGTGRFDKLVKKTVPRLSKPHKSYDEILADLIAEHEVEIKSGSPSRLDKEESILLAVCQKKLEEMTPEDRAKVENDLRKQAEANGQSFSGILLATGGLAAANLSGFSLYMLASTTVGTLTGLLGVTLPFVFYTGMSKAISIAIGPIAWTVLGAVLLKKILFPGKMDKRVLPAVIQIYMVNKRLQLEAESDKEVYDFLVEVLE